MLLNLSVTQVDRYSFIVKDTTTDETYADANVDLSLATTATLTIKNAYLPGTESVTIDIFDNWQYLLDCTGLTINIVDLPDYKYNDLDYFPDWMYEISVTYTYNARAYTKKRIIGFRDIITDIVIQQLQQSDWVRELSCGCEKYSTSLRKFNYLKLLEIASDNCLIMQYQELLEALYKLTGTTHEYAD